MFTLFSISGKCKTIDCKLSTFHIRISLRAMADKNLCVVCTGHLAHV